MKGLGSLLLFLGIGSCILSFTNYEFRLLSWIEMWGEMTAWLIRGGVIVLGAMLFLAGSKAAAKAA